MLLMLIQLMLTLMLMVIDNNWIDIAMPLTSHAKLDDQDRWFPPPTASLHWPSTKGLCPNPNKIPIIILLSGGWYRDVLYFSASEGDVPSTDSFARRATSKVSVIQACHLPRPSTSYKPEHMIVDRFDLVIFDECIVHPCCLICRNFDVHISVHEHQHLHCIIDMVSTPSA